MTSTLLDSFYPMTVKTLVSVNVVVVAVVRVISSRPEVFCKKGVLKHFAKFTGKHLCQPATLLKKRFWHRCFPVNFAKFLRTPFFIKHLW